MSLGDAAGGLKGLGVRFAIVSQLPVAALAFILLSLVWAGAPGSSPSPERLVRAVEGLGGTELAMLAVGVLLVALILQPLQLSMVRLLEGYATSVPGARRSRERHQLAFDELTKRARLQDLPADPESRRAAMADAETATRQLVYDYPRKRDAILATRLGNTLRAAENRAGSRYGLDTIIVWPRLYPLLADRLRAVIDDLRNQLDVSVRLAVMLFVAAIGALGLLVLYPLWWWIPALLVGLACASYRASVHAARAYGQALEVAIDLHRFDLLGALHLALPREPEAERRANDQLMRMLKQGRRHPVTYVHGPEEPTASLAAERVAPSPTATGADDAPARAVPGLTLAQAGMLQAELEKRVVGQHHAVTQVVRVICGSVIGLSDPLRPIASLIFVGPTGVGRSALAAAIADVVMGDERALVRIDMADYSGPGAAARLLGQPGRPDTSPMDGQLAGAVRRRPSSVLLLAGIDRSSPEVQRLLARLLKEGRLPDLQGRIVDIRRTVVIMTTDETGTTLYQDKRQFGFVASDDDGLTFEEFERRMRDGLEKKLSSDLLNAVDDVVPFARLVGQDLRIIVNMLLRPARESLAGRGIQLEITDDAIEHIIEKGRDRRHGVRALRQTLERKIVAPLAPFLASADVVPGATVMVEIASDDEGEYLRPTVVTPAKVPRA